MLLAARMGTCPPGRHQDTTYCMLFAARMGTCPPGRHQDTTYCMLLAARIGTRPPGRHQGGARVRFSESDRQAHSHLEQGNFRKATELAIAALLFRAWVGRVGVGRSGARVVKAAWRGGQTGCACASSRLLIPQPAHLTPLTSHLHQHLQAIAELEVGDMFGEMSALYRNKCVASVLAATHLEVITPNDWPTIPIADC